MSGVMPPFHSSSSCKLYVYLSSRSLVVRYKFLRGTWCLTFQSIISTRTIGAAFSFGKLLLSYQITYVVTFQKATMIITVSARYRGGCLF